MRRVVITGMGIVSPLGVGVDNVWRRLTAGQSGLRPIESFDVSDLPAKIAGIIPRGAKEDGLFNPDDSLEPKDQRKNDTFIHYAMAAADEAILHAGWTPDDNEELERTGVLIGSGIGGLQWIAKVVFAVCY